ncbi:MAG: hypothetical protein ACI4MH_02060 [Candidatus Coproplasma sp.]
MFRKIKYLLRQNKLTNEIATNYGFRTIIFSSASLAIGIAYAVYNLFVALIYRSLWFGSLACYYVMLDIIRSGVLLNRFRLIKKNVKSENSVYEIKQYLICGTLLILMTAFLSAMIIHITRQNKTFNYSLTVIYMSAGYTFYRIGISVYNFIKSRKQHDFTVRALRCINLATALVSFLSLQAAALTAFSTGVNQTTVNALTGGIVCAMIVLLGAFMIISAAIKLKENNSKTET